MIVGGGHEPARSVSFTPQTLERWSNDRCEGPTQAKAHLGDPSAPEVRWIDTGSCDVQHRIGRQKGTPYADRGLSDTSLSDDQLLDAIAAHPILMNRPIVVSPLSVKLCRPSETVLDLLPPEGLKPFTKEDGEVVIDADGHRVRR